MATTYFSDRENGPIARNNQSISPIAWAGLVAVIQSLVSNGAFARAFPKLCPDNGSAICGTNEDDLSANVVAHIPGLTWPLQTKCSVTLPGDFFSTEQPFTPQTLQVLDLLEYLFAQVSKPHIREHHKYFQHDHLRFDPDEASLARYEFCTNVNTIFSRQGIAYELQPSGQVIRLLPAVLGDALRNTTFNTGDRILDNALEESRAKFHSPDPLVRREALERIWDCWERIKTIIEPGNKALSAKSLLDRASADPQFRGLLDVEARALTEIGNTYLIRHFETRQNPVVDSNHVDYLFLRMFAMIQLLLGALQS